MMTSTLQLIYSLFKLRIGVAIALSALAGLAVTPGPAPAAWQVAVLALAVLLSSASAGAFNHFAERDLDARMARTSGRPFVTGELRPSAMWLVIMALLLVIAVAGAALALNMVAALHVFLGAFFYGIVYTLWLKRRSALNIVVGGLSGSFAVLAGAAAVDPQPAAAPILLAIVLFLWTPPHFWSLAAALRDDYAKAGVPMLPVVVGHRTTARIILAHTVALVAVSLMPVMFGMGWIYFVGAAVGGGWFLFKSIELVRHPGPVAAMSNFYASLAQLGLLLTAAIIDASVIS